VELFLLCVGVVSVSHCYCYFALVLYTSVVISIKYLLA